MTKYSKRKLNDIKKIVDKDFFNTPVYYSFYKDVAGGYITETANGVKFFEPSDTLRPLFLRLARRATR